MSLSIIDIVFLAVLLIAALVGLKKGFIKQVGKLISLVAAVVLAIMFFKQVAGLLQSIDFIAGWEGKINEWLTGKGGLFTVDIAATTDEAIKQIKEAFISMNLPEFIVNFLVDKIGAIDTSSMPSGTLATVCSGYIFEYICYALAFLLIFIAALIVCKIIVSLITKAVDVVPGVGFLNRLIGAALSVAKVCIVVWVVFYLSTLISAWPVVAEPVNNFIADYITGEGKSIVVKWFYENNWLVILINKLLAK